MKNKLYLALLSIAIVGTSFIYRKDEVFIHQFKGAWQLKTFNYGQGDGKPNMVTLKVFNDSTFQTYICTTELSAKTIEGKFNVSSDSLYSESVDKAYNSVMNGKTYEIKYKIASDTLTMSGEFDAANPDGTVSKRAYTETWVKLGFPPPKL